MLTQHSVLITNVHSVEEEFNSSL